MAENFVEGLGAMPADAQLKEVRAIASAPLNLEDGSLGPETVSGYIVDFGRFHDGIEIDGVAKDCVSVTIDADGVAEFHRDWRSIVGKESGLKARVTAEEALRVLGFGALLRQRRDWQGD